MTLRKSHRTSAILGSALLSLSLGACGGGTAGGGATGSPPQTTTLPSTASFDGWAAPGGNFVADAPSGDIACTGDTVMGFQSRRQFFSFDLSVVPVGAAVQSATLRLYQGSVRGTPYTTHGVVIVDHMDYGTLDGADYDAAALVSSAGTLSSNADVEYKTLDVTALVQDDLAAPRTRTQVRVRWSAMDGDGDPVDDCALFADAEDLLGTGYAPQLVVTYVTP